MSPGNRRPATPWGLLLAAVAWLVPREERGRWAEEWAADLDGLVSSGVGAGRIAAWMLGVTRTALAIRLEEWSMDGWTREIRYALRGLLRQPTFTLVAVFTLALGIGATTAIFSVVNAVVLQPLPYPDADELVWIHSSFPTMDFDEFWISPPEYGELQELTSSFVTIGAYRGIETTIGAGEHPEGVPAALATAQLFEALRVEPLLGRSWTRDEDVPGGPSVAVLSHALWTRSFGADPSVVGRDVEVDGERRTVIGVMPAGFDVDEMGTELWLPARLDVSDQNQRASHWLRVVARMAPGVGVARAEAELRGTVAGWEEAVGDRGHLPDPEFHPFGLEPLQERVIGDVRTALWVLLGAVGVVLVIAATNVANLLLARAESRTREVAVRVALGAGRGRLARQFLTEGLTLALLGGLAGLGVAWAGLEGLRRFGAGEIPRLDEVSLDPTVLGVALAAATATGLLFGLAPVRHLLAGGAGSAVRDGGRRTTRARGGTRNLLVVTEVALALVLAVGSGLLIRSFQALTAVDPGFDPRGVLTFQLQLPEARYPDPLAQVAFHRRLDAALEALPGVEAVAAMAGLPPLRELTATDTEFEGLEQRPEGPAHNVDYYQTVTQGYLELMDIDLVEGRGFLPSDGEGDVPVAVVNERLARTFFPGESPVGRRLRPCCGDGVPWLEIVGVVADVKQGGLDQPAGTEVYFLLDQVAQAGFGSDEMNLVLRTSVPPTSLAGQVREAVWALDGSLPVMGLQPLMEVVRRARARPRFLTLLLGLFAGVALLLAAVGTYGVMSYGVAQRNREMGIRMALGAEAGRVKAMVLRQGLAVAGVGLAAGIAGAFWLTRFLESLLFGVATRDPLTFVAVPLLLGAVAVAACWIPATRATRVDPVEVLRDE